ncbi:MAG TPA: hypothetical protein VLE72_01430 [Candidatus Saccharimonadales bacterium]|nr:hypothetical protein [Candidatus Saccharimonadales bacterium]
MSAHTEVIDQSGRWLDSRWFERLLELIPGSLTWTFLLAPVILSFFVPIAVAYFIIAFDLIWLVKSLRLSFFLIIGYSKLYQRQSLDWQERLADLEDLSKAIKTKRTELRRLLEQYPRAKWRLTITKKQIAVHSYYKTLTDYINRIESLDQDQVIKPSQLLNAVIISTFNESLATLEPSLQALTRANYARDQLILIIGYEERGGDEIAETARQLIDKYGHLFSHAEAIMHPDGQPGEGRVKGANMTNAAKKLTSYIQSQGIDPGNVIVTTFDSDHRPHPNYFAYLTFEYAVNPDRIHRSFQPIPMFYNNIWDVPAPMRLIATGNSFWMIMQTMRPHLLRNFAAHAQGLQALIDIDYWHLTSIVEDGHQFWRSYFRYGGDHQVVPVFVPVHQDAVLAKTYLKTFKGQYVQLRRWAWGISDFPYVVRNSIKNTSIPITEKIQQIFRLIEGHFSWATAPLILTFVAWLPLYLNRNFAQELLAHQLPIIASRILSLAMIGLMVTVVISLISLPPRPARYRPTKRVAMLFQWLLLPLTAIFFSAFAAIDAQTRLMLGRYLDWKVTEKATKP